MYNRKYSSRESEPQTWYFLPAQHGDLTKGVVSFRHWNIVIIAILGMMVLGLMLFAIVPPPPAHGVVFALHVTLSILAYAAFALSFVLSLIFLGEERLLRSRKLGNVVWRLPSLDLLDRMSHSSVIIGLVSIAIGTALGFISVDRLMGQYWYYDSKYAITLLVLFLYVLYLRLSRTTAWRGGRASKLCVFNFAVVVLSFTVVNLYLSHSHRYF